MRHSKARHGAKRSLYNSNTDPFKRANGDSGGPVDATSPDPKRNTNQ